MTISLFHPFVCHCMPLTDFEAFASLTSQVEIWIQISKTLHFLRFHENSRNRRDTPISLLPNVTTNFRVLLECLMNLERVMTHLLTGGSAHGCQLDIQAGGKNYR